MCVDSREGLARLLLPFRLSRRRHNRLRLDPRTDDTLDRQGRTTTCIAPSVALRLAENARFCHACGSPSVQIAPPVAPDTTLERADSGRAADPVDVSPAPTGSSKTYPNCGTVNPPRRRTCGCGYNFERKTGVVERPVDTSQGTSKPRWTLSAVATTLGAVMLGRYAGLSLLLPVGAAGAIWAIASRTVKGPARLVVPAFSVQGGHGAWMALGLFVAQNQADVLADLVILIVGLTWLILRSGLGSVLLLSVYQVLSVLVNLSTFLSVDFGGPAHRALAVHLVLRVTALVLMLTALRALRATAGAPRRGVTQS